MSEYLREYNEEEISRLKSPNKEEEEEVELEDESFSERNTEFTRILITFGEQGYQTDKSKEAWKNPDLLTQLYQRHLGKFNESYKNIRSTTFNPIKIFSDYVDFVNEYYPLGTTRPKEFILNLEKGINYIVNDTRASVRALHETLRIFLTYSKYLIDPTNLFAFMLANGIGTEHDEFFLQFSLAFDRKLNFAASEEVFLRGVLMKPYLSPKLMVHYNDGLIRYKNLMEALEALNLITIAPAMQLRQNEYTQRYHHTFSNPTGGPLCLTNTEVNPDPIFRRVNGKYKIIPMHIQSKRRLKDQLMGAEVSLVYRRCEELANLEHPENLVLDLEYNNIPLKYIPFKCKYKIPDVLLSSLNKIYNKSTILDEESKIDLIESWQMQVISRLQVDKSNNNEIINTFNSGILNLGEKNERTALEIRLEYLAIGDIDGDNYASKITNSPPRKTMKLDQSNRDENNNQIAPNIKLNKEELNLIQLIRTKTMFDGSSNLSYPKGIDAEYNIQDTSTYLKPRRADSAQDLTENHWVLTKKDTKDYVKYKQLKNTYRDLLIKRLQTSGRKAIELIKLHYQELERKNVSKNVIYEFFLDSRFGMIKKEAINELQNWKEQHLKESSQVFINGPQFIEEYVNTHINKFEFDEIEGIDTEEDIIDIKIEENTNDIE